MPLNHFFTPGFSNILPTHIKQFYNLGIIEFRLSDERILYSHYRAGVAPYLALAAEGAGGTPVEQKLMGRAEVHLKGIYISYSYMHIFLGSVFKSKFNYA